MELFKSSDLVQVNNLSLTVLLSSGSRWPPKRADPTAQPLQISLAIPHDIQRSAETDDLSYSINYSTLASTLRTSLSPSSSATLEPSFQSLEALTRRSFDLLLSPPSTSTPRLPGAYLKVVQTRPPLHCKAVGIESRAVSGTEVPWNVLDVKHFVEDLDCHTIVGVNAAERLEKQHIRINIRIEHRNGFSLETESIDFRDLTRKIYDSVEKTSYLTLEALTSHVALDALRALHSCSIRDPRVNVKVAKPDAIVFASSSEVEIYRTYNDFSTQLHEFLTVKNESEVKRNHLATIAFGSNLGDSFQNIEQALRLLESLDNIAMGDISLPGDAFVHVVNTSFLYESAPMYVIDQPPFINGACIIETNIEPLSLLKLLKKIEEVVGRVPSIRNGPRAIDLDIVFIDDAVIDTRHQEDRQTLDNLSGHLVVPHPRLVEREFVLRPLNDMTPDFVHPVSHRPVSVLLRELLFVSKDPPMKRVVPFPRLPSPSSAVSPTLAHWSYPIPGVPSTTYKSISMRTYLMTILNVTPDSFSDGSEHNTLSTALTCVQEAVTSGADIIDIGGYSTRPGADFVSVAEEIQRVVPVVEAIRRLDKAAGGETPISIDTFRPEVARAALEAGANCINDVYSFAGPEYRSPLGWKEDQKALEYMKEMKEVAREFAVPVVLMHSRGDAGKNKDYDSYNYSRDSSILEAIRVELGEKVDAVVKGKGGVRRWLVVVDPGVGFSKTAEDNLETLRNAAAVTADVSVGTGGSRRGNPLAGYPQLIGPSRKSFLGQILATKIGQVPGPNERVWATAPTVTCAVQQGALVVRVHDTREARDVLAISDSLWRS